MSDGKSAIDPGSCAIAPAGGPADMDVVRTLFQEYHDWLGFDLCFQGFEAELASLPGSYAPPGGGLWFAKRDDEIGGVVGLRPLETPGGCELKRLWLRPAFRGLGLGRRLTETAIAAAKAAGYEGLYLDTLPVMGDAHRLYERLGFRAVAPYYHNPIEGAVYLRLDLTAAQGSDSAA